MLFTRGDNMNDIVNLILNTSVSIVVIGYFILRDYKFNNDLVALLTKCITLLEEIKEDENK